MSGVVSDPNSLTKDKLKRDLARYGVALPAGDARKDVYVGLYRRHVLQAQGQPQGRQKELFHFSSDDDEILLASSGKNTKRKSVSPKKSPKKTAASTPKESMDAYSLSDVELIRQLKRYNVEYGPIVDSTRRIYQKKLQKLMDAGPPSSIPLISSSADTMPVDELDYSDQEEEEEELEPVVTRTRTVERSEVRQRTIRDQLRYDQPDNVSYRTAAREDPDVNYGRSSMTTKTVSSTSRVYSSHEDEPAPAFSASDIVTQAEEVPSETPKKGGLSIWIQLIIVLIVAFLIFLVFQNMEPAGKAPVRQLNHEDV